MIDRYERFLESKIDLSNLIGVLNDITDLFIDLDDRYGFDLNSKLVLNKKVYDINGKECGDYWDGMGNITISDLNQNRILMTGSLENVKLRIVNSVRVFIERRISIVRSEYRISKILNWEIKNINGSFEYGIGDDYEHYKIDTNIPWTNWKGDQLTSDINSDKNWTHPRTFNIRFCINFEI